MYKLSKLIITVIAIVSILCCVPVASAVDATEPPTEPTEATSEQATQEIKIPMMSEDNYFIFVLLFSIGLPTGCLLGQGLSFWKW